MSLPLAFPPSGAKAIRMLPKLFGTLLLFPLLAHAELAWKQRVQEFKCSPEQKSIDVHFAFKNTGATPVTIRSLTSSCGCTTARLDKKTYAPGETGEVLATYSFRGQTRALRKIVTVVTEDGVPP